MLLLLPIALAQPAAPEGMPDTPAAATNCATNIVSEVPNDVDWNNVYMIRGTDGSVWQRAIISSPRQELTLEEGKTFKIVGTADPFAQVQFFMFTSPKGDGPIAKPAHSVCLSGGQADENGLFSIPVNSRVVWDTVGNEVVLDTFFKLGKMWDQQVGAKTNQNYLIGTHLPLTKVKVAAKHKVPEGCKTLCQGYKESSGLQEVVVLDPTRFSDDILNQNFVPVKDSPTAIGKFGQTWYAGTKDSKKAGLNELQQLTMKAITIELIKQFYLGQRGLDQQNSLPMITGENILAAYSGGLYSNQIQELTKAIHDVLTGAFGSPEREAGINYLDNLLKDEIKCTAPKCVSPTRNIYHEIFPPSRPEANWQYDLLDIILLWTSRLETNQCILDENQVSTELQKNFLDGGKHHDIIIDCSWYMTYTHGFSTPAILLHDAGAVTLAPDFKDVRIMTSDVKFDGPHGWSLAAGKKSPIYYRYQTKAPIEAGYESAQSCVSATDAPDYADYLAGYLALNAEETLMLTKELEAQMNEEVLYGLRIANPADIAERFGWKIDGETADIFQLFFDAEAGACDMPSFATPESTIINAAKAKRDGFETGFVN